MPEPSDDESSFTSHLGELRRRLMWSLVGVFIAFSVVFALFADDIVRYVKDIAVISVDPESETFADVRTAVDVPYRGTGSSWTLRSGDGQLTNYEVAGVSENFSEVRKTVTGEDGDEIESTTFTRPFESGLPVGDGEAVTVTEPEDEIEVPAGSFACFLVVERAEDESVRTWVAKRGGLIVKIEGDGRESVLVDYDLKEFDEPIQFTVIATLETFSTTMRVSLYAAIVFAYPWVMFQIYLFVAPGLYRHERRFFQFAIPGIFVLFLAGAAFGRYVLLPISIPFLLGFNVQAFDVDTNYSLGQFLGLVFAMTFGLGFVFQIPLLVAPVVRFGLLSPEFFKSKRRYTVLVSVVVGALISPSGSPIDMVLAGAPVFFLVEGGVWFGTAWKRWALRRAEKEALKAAERGEDVDPEALAGGLAVDLEKRLKEFSEGGAREFARELIGGLRDSGRDVESIFDDEYGDDDKPPVEVKLKQKPRGRKDRKAPESKPDQMHDVQFQAEETSRDQRPSAPDVKESAAGEEGASEANGAWPDRPWDENVDEDMARYIEDRITQRLEQLMERELRPWMEAIERRLSDGDGDD